MYFDDPLPGLATDGWMTLFFAPDRETIDSDGYRSPAGKERLPEEILAPIIAGAYARGVAETFDMLGLSAVFLDFDGCVLHANKILGPSVGGPLQIRTDHIIARDSVDNRALSDLIAAALMPGASLTSTCLPHAGLTIHALPLRDHLRAAGQVLRVVLLVSDANDPVIALLAQRIVNSKF